MPATSTSTAMSTSAEAYYYDVLRRATIERLRAMLYAWDLPKYGTKEAMTSRIFLHVLARGLATGSTATRRSSTHAGGGTGIGDTGGDEDKVKVLRDAEHDYQARWAHLREWPVHPSPDQLRSVVEQSKVTARAASKKSRARKEREREREREKEMGERFADDEADAEVDVSDGADIDAGVDAGDVAAMGPVMTGVMTGTGTGTGTGMAAGTAVAEVKVEDREREEVDDGEENVRKRKRSAVEMDISAGVSVGMTQGRNHVVNVYGRRRNSGAGAVGISTGTGNGIGPGAASNGSGGGASRGLQNINHVIPHAQQQQQVDGGRHRMASYPSPPVTLAVDEERLERPRRDVNVVDDEDGGGGGGERTMRMLVNKAAAGTTTSVDREMVLLEQMCRIREMIAQEEKRDKPCMAVLAVYNAQLHKRMQRLNREP